MKLKNPYSWYVGVRHGEDSIPDHHSEMKLEVRWDMDCKRRLLSCYHSLGTPFVRAYIHVQICTFLLSFSVLLYFSMFMITIISNYYD